MCEWNKEALRHFWHNLQEVILDLVLLAVVLLAFYLFVWLLRKISYFTLRQREILEAIHFWYSVALVVLVTSSALLSMVMRSLERLARPKEERRN